MAKLIRWLVRSGLFRWACLISPKGAVKALAEYLEEEIYE